MRHAAEEATIGDTHSAPAGFPTTATPNSHRPRRRMGVALLVVATVIGVWLGVDAPDISPVAPAPNVAAQAAPDPAAAAAVPVPVPTPPVVAPDGGQVAARDGHGRGGRG